MIYVLLTRQGGEVVVKGVRESLDDIIMELVELNKATGATPIDTQVFVCRPVPMNRVSKRFKDGGGVFHKIL